MVLILKNSEKPRRWCKTWHVDLNMSLAHSLRHSLPPSTVPNLQLDFCSCAVNSGSSRKMASLPPSPTATLLRPPSYHPVVDWMPGDGAHPQYYVINPMHIVSLRDRSKTFGVRCVEKIKAISEKWFTHILLLLFLFGYAALGAVLFKMLEAPKESRVKFAVADMRNDLMRTLWERHLKNTQKEEWTEEVHQLLVYYEEEIYELNQAKMFGNSESLEWDFWSGMFYCCTVFTTIGYGNIFPSTTGGRAVTIIYAFIGIPFLLMVLADLGKLFTRAIKSIFRYLRMFYHTGRFRRMRRAGRRATAVPAQFMSVAWNSMPYPSRSKEKRANKNNNNNKEKDAETGKELDEDVLSYVEPIQPNAYNVDDEFNLPVSLAVLILLAYMTLGAWVFTFWENWTFFESFYFIFISMSTIGFGDLVPKHKKFMMGTFIYLLFGLALTSMCINVVQEKLSATFEMARLRLGTTFGLDVANMMQFDDYSKPDIAEVHGKSKSRSGSRSDEEKPTENKDQASKDKDMPNGKTKFQE